MENKLEIDEWEEERSYKEALNYIFQKAKKKIGFCKNYHLGDKLLDGAFNTRFNKKLELQELFDKKHNLTKKFYEALKYRILHNDHIILIFFGLTNSGKSWGAISLSYTIKKLFGSVLQNDSKIYLSFSDPEYSEYLPKMAPRDIMIRDETPKLSGTGTRTIQKNLDNITSITRAGQYCFLFISPKRIKADVVTYYLESAGINLEEEKTRFIIYDGNMLPLGRIFVRKPTDEEFLKEYEIKKKENIEELVNSAGLATVNGNITQMENDILRLAEFCKRKGARYKGEIKSQIGFFNKENPKNLIRGIGDYISDLINSTFLHMKNDNIVSKSNNKEKKLSSIIYSEADDFIFNNEKILDIVKENSNTRDIIKNLELYELRKLNVSFKEISITEQINEGAIKKRVYATRGALVYWRGLEFEKQFLIYLNDKYKDIIKKGIHEIKYFGSVKYNIEKNIKGKIQNKNYEIFLKKQKEHPDIFIFDTEISELVVLALKCLDLPQLESKYPYYYNWKEFKTEIRFAGENAAKYKNIYLYVVICDANTGRVESFPFDICNKKMIKINHKI